MPPPLPLPPPVINIFTYLNCLRTEQQAVEFLQQAVAFDDKDGHTWEELAYCYLMINDLQNSYTAYQHALYHIRNPKVGCVVVFVYRGPSALFLWFVFVLGIGTMFPRDNRGMVYIIEK